MKRSWTAEQMGRDDAVEVVHDFRQSYSIKSFQTALIRGKEEEVEGHTRTRPLVLGEERLKIELPRPSIIPPYDSPSTSISRSTNRLAVSCGELASVYELPGQKKVLIVCHPVFVDKVSFSPDGSLLLVSNENTREEG
jgi:hypothetical protein